MQPTPPTPPSPEMIEKIARVCHEANRAYCHTIGDDSQVPWDDAPEWQKDSARKGVEFQLKNKGINPQASHDSWMSVKLHEGWTYGPVKDVEKKQHPCLLPYQELPNDQKRKDFLFGVIVQMLSQPIY